MYGSQDYHLLSTIISTNSCDARPCLGDKTTNHKTGFGSLRLLLGGHAESSHSGAMNVLKNADT
jgi:hypothetical protein